MPTPKRILIVEDEADAREPLADVLELEGYTVFAHESAEDAAMHIEENDADVAIIDVRLPGRFGDDYARELAQKCPDTKIIFLTAEYKVDALKNKVENALVLSKPVDVDVLLRLIES